jgi:hypothetical protein
VCAEFGHPNGPGLGGKSFLGENCLVSQMQEFQPQIESFLTQQQVNPSGQIEQDPMGRILAGKAMDLGTEQRLLGGVILMAIWQRIKPHIGRLQKNLMDGADLNTR